MTVLNALAWVIWAFLMLVAGVYLLFAPLAIAFEIRARSRRDHVFGLASKKGDHKGTLVSVVVPSYNEERVLEACVKSILASKHRNLEVILVDDGSTDNTAELMRSLARTDYRVKCFTQPNSGKGAALNLGVEKARGEILLFVDADGLFTPVTITEMLRAFESPKVGAVCGADRPVNLDRLQTRFLSIISHVGTGFVRRALHMLHSMPVVSGNVGAFRRKALEDVHVTNMGALRTDTVGEDLELTWRLHLGGWKVAFAPRAIVYAESPSTMYGLWRQRVRWARGLLQSLRLHRRAIGNIFRHGAFGGFLAYALVAMVIIPVVQIVGAIAATGFVAMGAWTPGFDVWGILIASGLLVSAVFVLISLALDNAWDELKHAWLLPLWPIYSLSMSATMVWALWLELRGAANSWNKLDRTGVISREITDGNDSNAGPTRRNYVHH